MTAPSAKDLRNRLILVAVATVVFLLLAVRNGGGKLFLLPIVGALSFAAVASGLARTNRANLR